MKKKIITIGREFGSGGREIGKRLANALNITYYDKELLGIAAKESGLSTEFLESYDEKSNGSFLYSLVMGQANMFYNGNTNNSVEQLASIAQREAVMNVAEKGSCIIVGRCADYILKDEENILRVFICANYEDRLERIKARDKVNDKEAQEKIKRMDKARKAYYSCHADTEWGVAKNYDLCMNVSKLGIEKTVAQIQSVAEQLMNK
ncbi:MAG: cytidylate kinase-like family protein [Lachnospiraceae bacterium]|nr:cytidylate kinase-like family protein [Lachnospiraceae bacterium]